LKIAEIQRNLFLPGKYPFRSANALSLANYLHESVIIALGQNRGIGVLHKKHARTYAQFFLEKFEDWEQDFEEAWHFICNAYCPCVK
jgi:hypothetical protein